MTVLRRPATWLWLLAALTLLNHLGAGLFIGERHLVGTDAGAYVMIAQNLVAGNGFDCNGMKAWYAPLYPLLLTAPFGLTPRPFLVTLLAQGLLVIGIQLLVWKLARRLGCGEWTGVAAVAVLALDPFTFYFSVLLLTETLFTFLALLLLWLLVEAGARPRGLAWWLLAGAVLGFSALTRPVLQGYFPLFALGWWWYGGAPRRRRLLEIAVVGLMTVAVMLPWIIRNYNVFHAFVPVTNQSGMALYAGNNPCNHLGGGMGQGIDYDIDRDVPNSTAMNEHVLNRTLTRLALTYMAERPLHTLRMALVKLARVWALVPAESSGHTAWYQQALSLAWFAPLLPFMLWGMWQLRGSWRLAWPLYAYLAFMLAFVAVYYGTLRFRLPLHPLLAIWAAAGLTAAHDRWRAGRRRS
ncbi:MAG TPA: glycosyltransferase family 39 protein [bacterium]|nr:glycosyltransferase family 39 protein [bacterium]